MENEDLKAKAIALAKDFRVLYVEDDEETRKISLKIFKDFFYSVDTAEDGALGLEKFKANISSYDLVISDIMMPNMNGLDMIKNIKEIKRDTTVMIISAEHEVQTFLTSIELGVDGYIVKPFNKEQFINSILKVAEIVNLKKSNQKDMDALLEFKEAADIIFDGMVNRLV